MKRNSICWCIVFFATLVQPYVCQRLCHADYVTFGQGFGSKWGTPQHGTASDVITWSFMNDGTTLHASHPLFSEVTGTSNLSNLRNRFNPGVFEQLIQNAFNTWSAASQGRITFLQVPDNGAPGGGNSENNNNPGSWAIDIRIGAFTASAGSGFSFIGAVGYGPPGDDTFPFYQDGLAGDIIFNLSQQFFVAPGSEGDIFYNSVGPYINDLEGLMLHELGHAAIGLGHPNSGIGEVMYVNDFPNCCNFINRHPSPDDIAGAQSVYGIPAAEIINSWPYHGNYAGSGTPPWNHLDTSKVVLKENPVPQMLTFNNLINTAQGINGIVFDIQNLADAGNLGNNDFAFQWSPLGAFNAGSHPPASWQAAPAPSSISVTTGNPDRVLIEWPNGSLFNRWLRVTVLATNDTGLTSPAIYYIGHLLGETTGTTDGIFTVAFADITPIRSAVGQTVSATSITDIDKNGTVSFADISAMRGNVGAQLTRISVP